MTPCTAVGIESNLIRMSALADDPSPIAFLLASDSALVLFYSGKMTRRPSGQRLSNLKRGEGLKSVKSQELVEYHTHATKKRLLKAEQSALHSDGSHSRRAVIHLV